SRFQPHGPHGSSCVVDPTQFAWTDSKWRGVKMKGQIIYEMHVGTFTKEGTWKAAAEQLEELARIGISVVEMMPIADFPGNFGWGYDGVNLFAPFHPYGTPDDLRQFVDRAHSLGLAVILDVVYNHFGPDGNYLAVYSDDYQAHPAPQRRRRPSRCGLERRFSSQRRRRTDRKTGSLLQRLSRHAAGIYFRSQIRLFVSRTTLFLAGSTARHTDFRFSPSRVRRLYSEPRSSFEYGGGRTPAISKLTRPLSRDDCVALARPLDATAFSRPGIRRLHAVHIFHRCGRWSDARGNSQRALRISGAVPFPGHKGSAGTFASTFQSDVVC